LQYRIEHSDDRSESAVFSIGSATEPIEVAEKLVGSIDKMNDHVSALTGFLGGRRRIGGHSASGMK
jgi:hypothetical protein